MVIHNDTMAAALSTRLDWPEHLLLFEVTMPTGRRLDAVAMNLWRSRGLHIHGVEIKSERRDWLRELKNPAKADETARWCDFFWLAVSDRKILQDGELPRGWGLLVLEGERLVERMPAKLMKGRVSRNDRYFLSTMMRLTYEKTRRELGDDKRYNEAYQRGRASANEHNEAANKSLENRIKELGEAIAVFEEKSGLKISTYDAGQLGEAVSFVRSGGFRNMRYDFERLDAVAKKLAKLAEEGLALVAKEQAPT